MKTMKFMKLISGTKLKSDQMERDHALGSKSGFDLVTEPLS